MAISKKLTGFLEKNKIKYTIVEHKKVFTALDLVNTLHIKPVEVAKTLVLKADKSFVIALIPANKNLDKVKIKALVSKEAQKAGGKAIKSVDFTTETWMKKNIPGKIGSAHAFGSLLGTKTYMDKSLLKAKTLLFNTGEYTESFQLKPKDFVKAEKPILGVFSKAKK